MSDARTIERWECPVHGWDTGGAHRPPGSQVLSCGRFLGSPKRCRTPLVYVEYVPALQLREVAARADRLASELQSIADADPVDLALDSTWAQRVARDALKGSRDA